MAVKTGDRVLYGWPKSSFGFATLICRVRMFQAREQVYEWHCKVSLKWNMSWKNLKRKKQQGPESPLSLNKEITGQDVLAEFGGRLLLLKSISSLWKILKCSTEVEQKEWKHTAGWLCIFHMRVAALWNSFISEDDYPIVQRCRSSENSTQLWIAYWILVNWE